MLRPMMTLKVHFLAHGLTLCGVERPHRCLLRLTMVRARVTCRTCLKLLGMGAKRLGSEESAHL